MTNCTKKILRWKMPIMAVHHTMLQFGNRMLKLCTGKFSHYVIHAKKISQVYSWATAVYTAKCPLLAHKQINEKPTKRMYLHMPCAHFSVVVKTYKWLLPLLDCTDSLWLPIIHQSHACATPTRRAYDLMHLQVASKVSNHMMETQNKTKRRHFLT